MSFRKTDRYNGNDEDDFAIDDFDDFQKQLTNSIQESQTVLTIPNKEDALYNQLIEDFILNHKRGYYFTQLKIAVQEKKESLIVDYNDIINFSDQLVEFLLRDPQKFLHITFKNVIEKIDTDQNLDYFSKEKFFNIRLINYPIGERIRKIDVSQRDRLLSLRGIISKTGDKKPYVWKFYLVCPDCHTEEYLDFNNKVCTHCDNDRNMVNDKRKNIYTNCMRIQLQELSEDLEGSTPQSLNCLVLGDIIDEIKPGLKVTMTGFILLLENQRKIGVSNRTPYYVSVHVNNIEPFTSNDLNLIKKIYVTEKDEKRFIEMSKSPGWIDTLVESFAPHIYGLQNVKLGILLSIVGGGNFKVEGTDIRPRIHILICGDPSLAKTKLLKFTHKVVLGSISAIGKGASGGGLTAIVTKETDGSWTVQPGAIVFANKSLFLFDESDKVKDDVRDHLHESMEDGTVTVTKAGQIVTLQAESTTLFASNPKFSRYQDNLPLTENINLPPSLISRFDLVYVLKDNAMYDKQITDHINYIYTNRKIPNKEALLSIEDLTKYFLFVKIQDIDPEFDKDALDVLQDFYFGLRKQNTDDSLATTIRQYEGSLRMCRALARISLSRKITKNYAERIVNLVRSQLDSVMREADGTYNASLLEGKSKSKLVDAGLMRKIMIELEKDYDKHKIPISEIHNILVKEHSMTPKKIDKFLEEMIDQNIISNNGESFVKLSRYS
jgi:replicative DNA helicase Mcm